MEKDKDEKKIDIDILYKATKSYRSMNTKERKRYRYWRDKLALIMENKIMSCVGMDNRCSKEEMMKLLFLEIPRSREKYDEYSDIIKYLFKRLKSMGRPFINTKGYGGKGFWGYCIPDDLAFEIYDRFLKQLLEGVNNEQNRVVKITKARYTKEKWEKIKEKMKEWRKEIEIEKRK